MGEVRVVRPVCREAGVWENQVSCRGMFPMSQCIQSLEVERRGYGIEHWERVVLLHVELEVDLHVMDYGRVLALLVCRGTELFQLKGDRVPLRQSKGCSMNRHERRGRGSGHNNIERYGERGHGDNVG